jgi:hypothetical protein
VSPRVPHWRAQGSVTLDPTSLGLPQWRFAGGLIRDGGKLVIDFDLVATRR